MESEKFLYLLLTKLRSRDLHRKERLLGLVPGTQDKHGQGAEENRPHPSETCAWAHAAGRRRSRRCWRSGGRALFASRWTVAHFGSRSPLDRQSFPEGPVRVAEKVMVCHLHTSNCSVFNVHCSQLIKPSSLSCNTLFLHLVNETYNKEKFIWIITNISSYFFRMK